MSHKSGRVFVRAADAALSQKIAAYCTAKRCTPSEAIRKLTDANDPTVVDYNKDNRTRFAKDFSDGVEPSQSPANFADMTAEAWDQYLSRLSKILAKETGRPLDESQRVCDAVLQSGHGKFSDTDQQQVWAAQQKVASLDGKNELGAINDRFEEIKSRNAKTNPKATR